MANKISNSARRKRDILRRSIALFPPFEKPFGVLLNSKWCFALTTEQAMKDLLRGGYMKLTREYHGPRTRKTKGHITAKGRVLLEKLEQQKDKFKMT